MKNYKKPEILENQDTKFESVYADSGSSEEIVATCWKTWNRYNVDWNCKAKCPYYIHVNGWGWLNDRCSLAK